MIKEEILVWSDAEALSRAAAYFFVKSCKESIEQKGRFAVALSGGNTPKRLYQLLATQEFSRNIAWKKVMLFWGDERSVPHKSDESNFKMVKEALLDKVKIPKKNIFPVPVKGSPKDCALQYEATLKTALGNRPCFDLTLLGMGDDGHTASLFPGTDILNEKKRLIKEVWVEEKQTYRISVTYPLINHSNEVMFLVSGKAKAPVIRNIISGKKQNGAYPVQGVQLKKGSTIWLLDEAAIS